MSTTTTHTVVLELTTSEAIALSWMVNLGGQAADQLVLNKTQRIKFGAALTAADKLTDAIDAASINDTRCVSVGQLNDLRRLIDQNKHNEVNWLLTKILYG
jgi:hypothetical protein